MKKRIREISVDTLYPGDDSKYPAAVDSSTGDWYIYKKGKWVKALIKYNHRNHKPEYPRRVGKFHIKMEDTRLRFKDLPEGAMFRVEGSPLGRCYKYYFNKDFNAEIVGGQGGRVKIDKEAIICGSGYAGKSR